MGEFWADEVARDVEERVKRDVKLKKVVSERGYIVYDEKTPSGRIHIGSGRGWIVHDCVAKALRDRGLRAEFILSSDDIDPFDKLPQGWDPAKWGPYLGMPFRDIPSPEPGSESYADYYFSECVEKFDEFGIEATVASTGALYDSGAFDPYIKTALDKASEIQEIYQEVSGKSVGTEKLPFNPICDECGRIGTTYAYEWDPEREVIKYRCMKDFVDWAEGCGHEGEKSPYKGGGKFPWKVEWAAKWPTVGVVYEVAGKDHFTKGGSRDVAIRISDRVFGYPPPYPSTPTEAGAGYEFFNIGGRKMSTSKGEGVSFVGITEIVPARLLRFMMVKTRPTTVIDFDPYGTNKIILLADAYDRTERVYFGTEEDAKEDVDRLKRIYELSYVGKKPTEPPLQIPLTNAAIIAQVAQSDEQMAELLSKNGFIPEGVTQLDDNTTRRLEFARRWVKEYAPDEFKFELFDEPSPCVMRVLDERQIEALSFYSENLRAKKDPKEIIGLNKEVREKFGLKPNDFFSAVYMTLFGKDKGPRLALFISSIGAEEISSRIEKALEVL